MRSPLTGQPPHRPRPSSGQGPRVPPLVMVAQPEPGGASGASGACACSSERERERPSPPSSTTATGDLARAASGHRQAALAGMWRRAVAPAAAGRRGGTNTQHSTTSRSRHGAGGRLPHHARGGAPPASHARPAGYMLYARACCAARARGCPREQGRALGPASVAVFSCPRRPLACRLARRARARTCAARRHRGAPRQRAQRGAPRRPAAAL